MGMSPDILQRAANVAPPLSGKNVINLSVTDTAARFIIPTALFGKFATLTMIGAKADIVFGGSSVACAYGQASTVSSEAISLHASSGRHLPDGVPVSFQFPESKKAGYFSVDCVAAGSGVLNIVWG